MTIMNGIAGSRSTFVLSCALMVLLTILTAPSEAQQVRGLFQYERGEHTVVLAQSGTAQAVIVAADDAPPPVRFAADELKEHLDRMTGGDFAIVSDIPADGAAIVLGDTPAAREAGIDASGIARDGYVVLTVGQRVFIAGRDEDSEKSEVLLTFKSEPFSPTANRYQMEQYLGAAAWDFERGTLYGAYRFLEELGVRWFFPGPHGTVVPSRPDLDYAAVSLYEEPAYILRTVGTTTWQWYMIESSAAAPMINRAEYEELGWGGDVLRLWLLRIRHSSEWFAFNHRPPRMDLEERFGAQHPEYFALRENGQRDLAPQPGRTGHLCYTEPGVLELTKRDIDAYYAGKTGEEVGLSSHRTRLGAQNRGWPSEAIYGRTISLLPHDSFIACTCDNCRPFVHKDRDPAYSSSELVWQFVEKVARWLEEAHPGKLVTCLAYSSYTIKPDNLHSLPYNVVVGYCPAVLNKTFNNVDPENYARFMHLVEEWSAVNNEPMLVWLHQLYRHRAQRRQGVPMMLTGLFGRMFRDLSPHADKMYIELDSDSIMLEHLNRYVMMKLLYNPNLDPQALVEDYAHSFYGPGAEIALELLGDVEARSMDVALNQPSNVDVWEEYFTEEVVDQYRRQTDELLQLTANTPYEANAALFSRWFVGAIETGRDMYVRHVKVVGESQEANITIRALVDEITVDGVLDEASWQGSAVVRFGSNIDGKKTQWPTELRLLRSPENLYFAFTCHDPHTMQRPLGQGETDSVEIFLDPEHNHDSYYWLWIDMAGRLEDWFFQGGGEPADTTWQSGAEVAVQRHDDHWIVEVRLPRASIHNGLEDPVGRPWGANFARSCNQPPRPEDKYSCWSPLLRGAFHQPDLFGHIFFMK